MPKKPYSANKNNPCSLWFLTQHLLAATAKPEYMERAMAYFQLNPLLPKAVANTI